MPLNVIITTTRSNKWDLFARIQIKEAATARERVFEFKELFERFIEEYKKDTTGCPAMFYKVFWEGDIYAAKVCEVWHMTAYSEKKRKVAIITQI